jgi:hypothetical protein
MAYQFVISLQIQPEFWYYMPINLMTSKPHFLSLCFPPPSASGKSPPYIPSAKVGGFTADSGNVATCLPWPFFSAASSSQLFGCLSRRGSFVPAEEVDYKFCERNRKYHVRTELFSRSWVSLLSIRRAELRLYLAPLRDWQCSKFGPVSDNYRRPWFR